MTTEPRHRVAAILLSTLVHVAIGALFWLAPPTGDGGRAARKSGSEGVIVIELIPLDRAATGRPQPTAARSTQAEKRLPLSDPQVSARSEVTTPAANGLSEPHAATPAASTPDLPGQVSSDLAGATATRYRELLLAHIGRYRQYPPEARRDRVEGTVWVRFLLDRNGRVVRAWIETSSGRSLLDQEAVAAIRRAEPLPPIPTGLPDRIDITLPIEFDLG